MIPPSVPPPAIRLRNLDLEFRIYHADKNVKNMNIDENQGDEGDLSSVSSVFMTDSSNMSESEYDISAGTLARVSVMKVLMLSSFCHSH